jgi:hypothetical protein
MVFKELGSQLAYRIPSKHEMECTFPHVESVDAFKRQSFIYVRHQFERLQRSTTGSESFQHGIHTADAEFDADVVDSFILALPEGHGLETRVRGLCFRAGQDDWSPNTQGNCTLRSYGCPSDNTQNIIRSVEVN